MFRPARSPDTAASATVLPHTTPAADTPGAAGEMSLASLLELGHELAERNDLFEIADVALFNLMGHFGCSKSALWLCAGEEGGCSVELLRAHGIPAATGRALGAMWSRWLSDRPSSLREPMALSSLARLGTVPGLELAEAQGLAVVAPLSTRRRFLGLVALGRRVSNRTFASRDLGVLGASLDFLGLALENSRARVQLVESNRRLRGVNERLEELDRLKGEFLSNLNHELRTPLTILVAYVDSLLQVTPAEDPRQAHLRVVRDETTKLETMLMTLLEFRSLDDEATAIEPVPTDLKAALAAYVEDCRPGVTAKLRELRFAAEESVPPALCDERRVRRIVSCLLENAVKFTPAGSVIRIRVESAPAQDGAGAPGVRVEVADDGPGIPAEQLAAIWDSFRQGDGSSTRRHGGLGIGLAFARRLADRMDGRLEVESEPGKGATFRLTLPLA